MMPFSVVPAQPGTLLFVLVDEHTMDEPQPVVAWRCFEAGKAHPICVSDVDTSVPGVAVSVTDAEGNWRVFDLTTGVFFDDENKWQDSVIRLRPYLIGHRTPESERLNKMTRPVLSFAGRVYAKASFWKIAPPGGHLSVFTLPGGEKSPTNPFVSKITRDEFYAARKTIMEIPFETLRDDAQPLPKDEPEDDDDDLI